MGKIKSELELGKEEPLNLSQTSFPGYGLLSLFQFCEVDFSETSCTVKRIVILFNCNGTSVHDQVHELLNVLKNFS